MADYIPKYDDTDPLDDVASKAAAPSLPTAPPSYESTHAVEDERTKDLFFAPPELRGKSMEQVQQMPVPKVEGYLGDVAQSASLGFSDEIEAAAMAGTQKMGEKIRDAFSSIQDKDPKERKDLIKLYKDYRDLLRTRQRAHEEQNPKSSMAAQLAGGFLTGGNLAKQGVKGLAKLGAMAGLGTSEAELAAPPEEMELGKAAVDVGLGTTLGGISGTKTGSRLMLGGLAGYGASKVLGAEDSTLPTIAGAGIATLAPMLSPENLSKGASKLARSALGVSLEKDIPTVYDKATGKASKDVFGSKGIGETALKEDVLSLKGGAQAIYQKIDDAISNNYDDLAPLMRETQEKLAPVAGDSIYTVGDVNNKVANFTKDFEQKIPTPIQDRVDLNKYFSKYGKLLREAEGNLEKLTEVKRALAKDATSLSPEVYDPMTGQVVNTAKEAEAKYLKQISGIVRQHIEELAATVDKDASKAISDTNKTIGNLITAKDSVWNMLNKKDGVITPTDLLSSTVIGLLSQSTPVGIATLAGKKGLEYATGHPVARLSKLAGAKGLSGLSKASEKVQQVVKKSGVEDASKFVYNASSDTLKKLSNKMSTTPGLETLGTSLSNALENSDMAKKNAILFVILQRPETRELVTEMSRSVGE